MSMLLKIMNAKNTLELGVFTSYSLLTTALALSDDGKVTAVDIDRHAYEVASGKADCMDFVFVDTYEDWFKAYHEKLTNLVKVGGIIVYDNTLLSGFVAMDESEVPEGMRASRQTTIDFNNFLISDPRVEISQLSIGDGVVLCRRLY